MIELPFLGKKLPPESVAELFEVAVGTVLRDPAAYGGVKRGRHALFFENLVSDAIRKLYAQQVLQERQVDGAVARANQGAWEAISEPATDQQSGGQGMGSCCTGIPQANGKTARSDPFGLLDGPSQ